MARVVIHPPLAGISRATGFQTQPPYTCVESKNLWPIDVHDGRLLTATRPPLATITAPSSAPVNMIAQLNLPVPTLYAASNGKFYQRSNTDGTWTQTSSSYGVTTGRPVFAAPFFRQLVIANTGTPLHFDDDTNVLQPLVATSGFVPDDCRLAMNFQGSIWLGGSPTDELGPHVFACCRYDNLFDWDYSADDVNAAYISTGEDKGLINEPLTSMFAFSNDQAIFGCEESVWVLTGHPRRDGRYDRVSAMTGVLGQNAYAITPKGVFFLSHDGLMLITRNDYNNFSIAPISKSRMPNELLDLPFDALQPTVAMSYCSRWNCIYITVRGEKQQAWAYFLETGAFTAMDLPMYPLVMYPFEQLVSDDTSGVVMGGTTLRRFDRTGSETIVEATQVIGPVQMSESPLTTNMITKMTALFSGGTTDDNAYVEVYTGGTANIALNRALSRTGGYSYKTTVGSLRKNNRNMYPMLNGHAVALRIGQSNTANRIVFEDVIGDVIGFGPNNDLGAVAPVVTTTSPTSGLLIDQ